MARTRTRTAPRRQAVGQHRSLSRSLALLRSLSRPHALSQGLRVTCTGSFTCVCVCVFVCVCDLRKCVRTVSLPRDVSFSPKTTIDSSHIWNTWSPHHSMCHSLSLCVTLFLYVLLSFPMCNSLSLCFTLLLYGSLSFSRLPPKPLPPKHKHLSSPHFPPIVPAFSYLRFHHHKPCV